MLVSLDSRQRCIAPIDFIPWREESGLTLRGPIAIDTETTLIDRDRAWLIPPMVLAAATDGHVGVFLTRDTLSTFLREHADCDLIFHNASFDLAVIDKLDSSLAIYDRVKDALVWDTRLLHRLFVLATEGHTGNRRGQSTLETCVRTYLGAAFPKETTDEAGDVVRTSYGKFLGKSPSAIPEVYLDYLGKDVIATWHVWSELRRRIDEVQRSAPGFGSPNPGQSKQLSCWGPLTHHIQLMAEIVLDDVGRTGMSVDVARRDELDAQLEHEESEWLESLHEFGYLPGPGSQQSLQAILKRAERETGITLPRTDTGKISTSETALEQIADHHPFAKRYLAYKSVNKLRKTFLAKLTSGIVRPSYNVLVATGRTSSFGDLNAQNLPKDDSIRGCFVPRAGDTFVVADYAAIELRTLAQALMSQFGLTSQLAQQLNAGIDPHRRLAARVTGKAENEVTKEERQAAKAINFGKPGGMGNAALQNYARASFGISLSDGQVEEFTQAYFAEYPEIQEFLDGDPNERGGLTAMWLGLTPADHCQQTGDSRFLDHPENDGLSDVPHAILGAMALKVYGHEDPETRDGTPYRNHDIDYFWSKLHERRFDLPYELRLHVEVCRPSWALRKVVARLADRYGVWTLTGRLRANASWTARHNCVFQGLAADGAKLALWLLWREGYRIVAFVHDEVVVEIPDDEHVESRCDDVKRLMIEAMRLVVPDVRIDVDAEVRSTWASSSSSPPPSRNRSPPNSQPNSMPDECVSPALVTASL